MEFFKNWLLIPLLFLAAYLAFKWYQSPNFGNGAIAADFAAVDINGDSLRLSDYRGKIVLLEFWGSWCRPCREFSPSLRMLHQRYHKAEFATAKGYETIIVGIDTDKARWQKAVENDDLTWARHISSFQRFNDPIALLYGVKAIPASFLIDEQGRIIGVNASEIKLNELLRLRLKDAKDEPQREG